MFYAILKELCKVIMNILWFELIYFLQDDEQDMMVIQWINNLGEILLDGIEGEWHVVRVVKRISYVCNFGVCPTYREINKGDTQIFSRIRSQIHGLSKVTKR